MVGIAVGIGVYGYNLGLARGLAEAGRTLGTPEARPMVMYPRMWSFGSGFFPFFPLFVVLSWFFLARALFWRGGWGRHYRFDGVPPAFDKWHRRAHARQEPPPQTNA